MTQAQGDQNMYHPQMHLPPQFRNSLDLFIDDRNAINYNLMRPYIPGQIHVQQTDYGVPNKSDGSLIMRKPRRCRTTFTSHQLAQLEEYFKEGKYLNATRIADLSNKLSLGHAQVKIWFKNRRRKLKLEEARTNQSIDTATCIAANKDNPKPTSDTMLTSTGLTPSPTLSTTPILTDQYTGNSCYSGFYHNQSYEQRYSMPYYYAAPSSPHQYYDFTKMPKCQTDYNYNVNSIAEQLKFAVKSEVDYVSGLSPSSESCEPLTPKTDESSKNEVFDSGEDMRNELRNENSMMDPFYKTLNAPGYQSTVENILQAYSNHRNSSENNVKFSYCFN